MTVETPGADVELDARETEGEPSGKVSPRGLEPSTAVVVLAPKGTDGN